jgi:hypothetical protein
MGMATSRRVCTKRAKLAKIALNFAEIDLEGCGTNGDLPR